MVDLASRTITASFSGITVIEGVLPNQYRFKLPLAAGMNEVSRVGCDNIILIIVITGQACREYRSSDSAQFLSLILVALNV
jgi:hypothetical protein